MKLQNLSLIALSLTLFVGCSPVGQSVAQQNKKFHTPKNWQKPVDLNAGNAQGFNPDFSGQGGLTVEGNSEFRPLFSGSESQAVVASGFNPIVESGAGEQMQGKASWYGPGFHGKKTANGEEYDQEGMTAAHRYLPMNTWVRVTNEENGKTAVVRINDRGPYKNNRVIDLTKSAAKRIGSFKQGTANVKLEVLKYPKNYDASKGMKAYKQVVVQVAVFTSLDRAEQYKSQLTQKFEEVAFLVDTPSKGSYHVVAGPFEERNVAKVTANKLGSRGFSSLVRSYRK